MACNLLIHTFHCQVLECSLSFSVSQTVPEGGNSNPPARSEVFFHPNKENEEEAPLKGGEHSKQIAENGRLDKES